MELIFDRRLLRASAANVSVNKLDFWNCRRAMKKNDDCPCDKESPQSWRVKFLDRSSRFIKYFDHDIINDCCCVCNSRAVCGPAQRGGPDRKYPTELIMYWLGLRFEKENGALETKEVQFTAANK
jgi:hypothetical protein